MICAAHGQLRCDRPECQTAPPTDRDRIRADARQVIDRVLEPTQPEQG